MRMWAIVATVRYGGTSTKHPLAKFQPNSVCQLRYALEQFLTLGWRGNTQVCQIRFIQELQRFEVDLCFSEALGKFTHT